MKLILALLFVGVCACAKVERRHPPPYLDAHYTTKRVGKELKAHVSSMNGSVPLLSDYRRHYAEIAYVVGELGNAVSGCLIPSLPSIYQKELNKTAPEAISKPQKVIDGVAKLSRAYNAKTEWIREVIEQNCLVGTLNCDQKVDEIVNMVGSPLKYQAKVLLAGGEAAKAYLKNNDECLAVSKKHGAHRYVINGLPKLEEPIKKFGAFLQVLRNKHFVRC